MLWEHSRGPAPTLREVLWGFDWGMVAAGHAHLSAFLLEIAAVLFSTIILTCLEIDFGFVATSAHTVPSVE